MKNLIGISGKMGTGKDEIGLILQDLATPTGTYSADEAEKLMFYTVKKFAYKVKVIASMLTGFPTEEFEKQSFKGEALPEEWNQDVVVEEELEAHPMTAREMLQKIGTNSLRDNLHPNTWVNALFSDYTVALRKHGNDEGGTTISNMLPNWIITDVRFPNEVKAIKSRGGIIIRVNRETNVIDMHASETSLDDYEEFDYIVDNNGSLEDLRKKVVKIYDEL